MTDNTFAAAPEQEPDGSNLRTLMIAGGVAGAALVLGGGFFLLHGGGSSNDASTFALVPHGTPRVVAKPATAKVTTAKSTTRKAVTTLPPATSVKIGRDPFAALYIPPVTSSTATTTTPASTSTSTAGSTSTSTATSSTTATASNARYTIMLKKIAKDPGGAYLTTFSVAGKDKTVLTAQRFGKYGELVVLTYVKNAKGAIIGVVLQVGDDNPIEVVTGSKVSVE